MGFISEDLFHCYVFISISETSVYCLLFLCETKEKGKMQNLNIITRREVNRKPSCENIGELKRKRPMLCRAQPHYAAPRTTALCCVTHARVMLRHDRAYHVEPRYPAASTAVAGAVCSDRRASLPAAMVGYAAAWPLVPPPTKSSAHRHLKV